MPNISIIIPVYNVKQYLEDCLESILNQDYKIYEIILVNDGSTDGSADICNLYSDKYSFISTIHKENGGLSDARNVGLKKSNGDYILFIDSDDMIFENSLEKIHQTLEEDLDVDVVFLEAVKLFPNGKFVPLGEGLEKSEIYKRSQEEVFKHLANLPKFPGSACTKLVKRSMLIKNKIYFEKGLYSEDIEWSIRLLTSAKKYNYCHYQYYYYRQQSVGSITNTIELKNVVSLLNIIKKWSSNPQINSINGLQHYINSFMAYEYLILLPYYGGLNKKDKNRLKLEVKEYSWLLSIINIKRVRVARILQSVLGVKKTATLLNFYLTHR